MFEWESLVGNIYHIKVLPIWPRKLNDPIFFEIEFLDGIAQGTVVKVEADEYRKVNDPLR